MPGQGGKRIYDFWNTSFPPWLGIFFKLSRCGYTLRVTSQASYAPEYIIRAQKNHICLHVEISVIHSSRERLGRENSGETLARQEQYGGSLTLSRKNIYACTE